MITSSLLVTCTAGATRFETNAGSETRPSIGAGGAVRWMVNGHRRHSGRGKRRDRP